MLINIGYFTRSCSKTTINAGVAPVEITGDISGLSPEWELQPSAYDAGTDKYLNIVSAPASGASQSDYDVTPINTVTIVDDCFTFGSLTRMDQVNTAFMNTLHHYHATNLDVGTPWTIYFRGTLTLSSMKYFIKTKGGGEGLRINVLSTTHQISGQQENNLGESVTYTSTNLVTANVDTTVIVSWDPFSGTMRFWIGNQAMEEIDTLWSNANAAPQVDNAIAFADGSKIRAIGMLNKFLSDSDAAQVKAYLNNL